MKLFTTIVLASSLAVGLAMAQPATPPAAKPAADKAAKTATTKTPETPAPTAAEIADAKAKGLVWVNTTTKVYHKDGAFYGKTKRGKFMTEADAQKGGFKAAQEPKAKTAKPADKK